MSGLTLCTLTTAGYEPYTRVLAGTLAEHAPGLPLIACTLDEPDPELDAGVEQLSPSELGIERDDLDRIAAGSSIALLADRLKPAVLRSLLDRTGGPVLFVDSDSAFYGPLEPVADQLERNPILLTPHSRELPAGAPLNQCEIAQLRCGVINGGWIGVAPGAEDFLDWLWARARVSTAPEDSERLLHAQRWLDLAVGYFGPEVWRDARFNLTVFDLIGRDIGWNGDQPLIDGAGLAHFHFLTEVDPHRPGTFTSNPVIEPAWPRPAERPGTVRLFDAYRSRILAAGYDACGGRRSRYALFEDGEPILPEQKALYCRALYSHEHAGTDEPPNPFREGRDAFETWCRHMGVGA